jgi:hypothetical protein
MGDYRLGDDLDDYCVKCKRLTNHSILAIVGGEPAKVRCRTCYNEQAYRRCEVPPTKRELKKAELFRQVLASTGAPEAAAAPPGGNGEPAGTVAAKPKARKS